MADNLSFINWGFKPTTTIPEDGDYWLIMGYHIDGDSEYSTYWIQSKEYYPVIDDASLSEILEENYGGEVEIQGRIFLLWGGENAWRLSSYKGITLEQKEFLHSCSIY
tara:strand:+ start:2587 stop:2910 length:324 start_codon:yes stop_codon:yes gene_type:complete